MKSNKSGAVQYAALPYRLKGGLEVLMITSRETHRWVIPKGWPINALSAADSARIEAFEEAGVEGRIAAKAIGAYPYLKVMKDGEQRAISVEVFPLLVERELPDWPERGERERRWFKPPQAAGLVDEPELAQILGAFRP